MASICEDVLPSTTKIKTHDSTSSNREGIVIDDRLPPLLRDLDPEEIAILEKKLKNKIDWRMMPIMILLQVMNYLDRNAIGAARLAGLEEDLRLVGYEFQTCVTILFVGYILMQVPSNLLLNRIGKPSIYLPACMAIWGLLCACSGLARSYHGLLATRFLLGFFEAALYPGCVATLGAWYVKEELSLRTGIFYCGSMLSGAFSGLIAAGITDGLDGTRGLRAWRWLFIIYGSATIVVSIVSMFILPDFPATTKWLTAQERELALWRLKVDAAGEPDWMEGKEQPMVDGFKMVLRDPLNWIMLIVVYGAASAIAINSFFPTVVATLGKGKVETLLLTVPPYLLACLLCIGVSWHADRTKERYLHTVGPIALALAGFVISAAATGIGPRYFGAMIMLPGVYTAFNMCIVWTSNTMSRPPAKRAAAVAFNNAVATICSIYGSYLYPNNAAPRFVLAFGVNAGMALMAIIAATILRIVLVKKNKEMDRRDAEPGYIAGNVQQRRYLV